MRRAAVLVVLSVLAAACGSGGEVSTPEPTVAEAAAVVTPADLDATAMGQYLRLLEDDGDPVEAALVNFAMHFGSIDGVDAPAFDDTVPLTATDALSGIEEHWEALSDVQRRAVALRLAEWIGTEPPGPEPPTDQGEDENGLGVDGPSFLRTARQPDDMELERAEPAERELWEGAAREAKAWLRDQLPPGGGIEYLIFFARPDGGPIGAETLPRFAAALEGTLLDYLRTELGFDLPEVATNTCWIFISNARTNPVAAAQDSAIAHELFHCWSMRTLGLLGHNRTPTWVQEGIASWVGETYAGGSSYSASWWQFYLRKTSTEGRWSTFNRNYDAIGFWSAIDMLGGDLFSAIPGVLTAATSGDDQRSFSAATASLSPAGFAALSATSAREPGWGPSWDLIGPGITGSGRQPEANALGPVAQSGWTAGLGDQTNRTFRIDPGPTWAGVLIQIGGPGQIRWANGEEAASTPTLSAAYCIAGPCVCPDGEPLAIDLLPYSGDPTLAVATAGTATATTLASVEVADETTLCEPTECPPPVAGADVFLEGDDTEGALADEGPSFLRQPAEVECAPCPAGTWEADAPDAEAYFRLLYEQAGVATTYNGGRMVATFNDNFSFSQVIEAVDMETMIDGERVQRIFDSVAEGFWGVVDGQLMLKFESIVNETTTIVGDVTGDPVRTILGPEQLIAIPFEAECTDTTLRLTSRNPRGVPEHWTSVS